MTAPLNAGVSAAVSTAPRVVGASRASLSPPRKLVRHGISSEATPRRVLLGVAALLTAACLLQRPGQLIADTKLPMILHPGSFLASAMHLWNPATDFGTLQNQAVGYAFPMGTFFLLGRVLGIAAWVTERLWLALLLSAAVWGVVRLAEALRIGRAASRVLAGLAYALSPFFLSQLGSTSVGVLAAVVLPWALLPLVLVTRTDARLSPRRAAALSGLAIAAAGGVNASVTLAAVLPPALWLLTCRGSAAWRLRGWWVLCLVLACFWWLVPLFLQGRYGMNFVAYSETADVTTSVTSSPEVLRGTPDWLSLLVVGRVWLPAGMTYLTSVPVIVASWVVTIAGLVGLGLLRRRGLFLIGLLGFGTVLVAAGYYGPAAGLLGSQYRDLLTGSLSPLRNVAKFEPLVRLPLALGVAHLLARIPASRRLGAEAGQAVAAVLALVVIAVTATPLLVSRITTDGSFTAVPAYWKQAATWLDDHAQGGRTLALPGSAFGEYEWGRPMDEPLSWLARTPWGTRSLLPLGGEGSTRLLDGIETALSQGSAPRLADVMRRAGVSQLLVRHDLDPTSNDPRPTSAELRRALAGSGLTLAQSFGPVRPTAPSPEERLLGKKPGTSDARLEVWQVPGGAGLVDTYPASQETVVSGGPEAIPTLAARGLLGQRPIIMAGDLSGALPAPVAWFGTDTLQRRDENFGQVHRNVSYLLAPGELPAGSKGPVEQRLNVLPANHQTVSAYAGVAKVSASSYGFPLGSSPMYAPFYAVDGDNSTAWQAAAMPRTDVGQWLQVDFTTARTLPAVTVRLFADSPLRPKVTALRVTTDQGSIVTPVASSEAPQRLRVPEGSTKTFRITFAGISQRGYPLLGPGIREIQGLGTTAQRIVVLPTDVTAAPWSSSIGEASYVFDRARTDPAPTLQRDEERELSRQFVAPRALQLTGAGSVLVDPSAASPFTSSGRQTLECGSGPTVLLDDQLISTALTGSKADVAALRPVSMRLCTPPAGIPVAAGTHNLQTLPQVGIRGVDQFVLSSNPAISAVPVSRTAKLQTSTPEHRSVALAAGPAVFLAVHENANDSWSASLNGKTLQSVRLDGWQQGYFVPAGAAGTVVLTNNPGILLRWELLAGALLALGLVLLALIPGRATGPGPRVRSWEPDARTIRALCLAAGVGIALLVSWPAVLAIPVVVVASRLWQRAWVWIAVVGAGCAAVATAVHPGSYPSQHIGAYGALAVLAATVALIAVVVGSGWKDDSQQTQVPDKVPVS